MRKLILSVLFASIASIIANPIMTGATENTPGSVTVTVDKLGIVPSNLPWSKAALDEARPLISLQSKALMSDFAHFKAKGNNRVQVVYEKQSLSSAAFADSKSYGTDFLPWHLVGNLGGQSATTKSYPLDKVDLASYLTKPAADACSLSDFSIFDFQTWFQPPKCSVATPSPQKFLAASLATALKKSTLDIGSVELQELKYALSAGTHPRISGGYLICPELASVFGGTTRVALASKNTLGGYSFSADLVNRTAAFRFLGPDLASLAKAAYKVQGENFVRFFTLQVHN